MSDRLPGRRKDYSQLDAPKSDSAESKGVNGEGVGGSPTPPAQNAPPVSFLREFRSVGGTGQPAEVGDLEFESRWPAIWEYVTARTFQGKPRETATLLVFREEGAWKACLCDRETERVLFRSGDSFKVLLDAVEAALVSPRADWRASKRKR